MFEKDNKNNTGKSDIKDESSKKVSAPPLKPFSRKGKHSPAKPPIATSFQPDTPRRSPDFSVPPISRMERPMVRGGDHRRLVVGRDIRLKGEITSCETLIIEGHVEITLPDANNIEITATGCFKGTAEISKADISGEFEGTLTARDQLIIRSSGRVSGKVRYGKIVIEGGGQVSGDMKSISDDKQDT